MKGSIAKAQQIEKAFRLNLVIFLGEEDNENEFIKTPKRKLRPEIIGEAVKHVSDEIVMDMITFPGEDILFLSTLELL